MLNVKYPWQQTLDRYGVDTILMPTDAPLSGALKESRRWRVAYDDGMSIVFPPGCWLRAGRWGNKFSPSTAGGSKMEGIARSPLSNQGSLGIT